MVMAFPPFLRVGAPLSVTVRRNERILRVVLLRGRLGGLGRWFRLVSKRGFYERCYVNLILLSDCGRNIAAKAIPLDSRFPGLT